MNHLSLPFRTLVLLFALSWGSTAFAQTWTGAVNTNWNVAGNWSPVAVPIATGNVVIPNTTNKPVITAGTLAVAKSVWVKPLGMLTINLSGSLTINGSAADAIFNEGTLTNNATIKIGSTTGIGGQGINNKGSFTNQSGTISIDRISVSGIVNDLGGTFINKATIKIGSVTGTSIGSSGISNYASFTNESGTISIDRTGNPASSLYNASGTFTNKATITIGGLANIGVTGILNAASFTNQSGTINIDRASNSASGILNLAGGVFTNKADLKIGAVANIGGIGISNYGSFTNEIGTIGIDRMSSIGISNASGTFTNKAAIKIGNVANLAAGIANTATFMSESGTITICQTGANKSGIENISGTFTNKATILVGTTAAVPGYGIRNQAIFLNDLLGIIHVNRTGQSAILNQTGTFTNKSTINIGNLAFNITGHGIANFSTFVNETGTINIDRISADGINNAGGTFTNKAAINIGATANIGANGIVNAASFTNESGGIIISRTTIHGINNAGGTFTNKSGIAMGTIAATSIGGKGIENSAIFTNQSGAIVIDRATQGIKNAAGTFTNKASIVIGSNAAITGIGVENLNIFLNDVGATMSIDRTNMDGVTNNASCTFTNKAILRIGSTANINGDGIRNFGTFTNETGTINIDRIAVFGKIGIENQAGIFTNKATINMGAFAAAISGHGISNSAVFVNQSGTIAIDRSTQSGIYNQTTGTFTNFAAINLGGLASISGSGIWNTGPFTNEIGGSISINRTTQNGIYNQIGSTFINKAIIAIGSTANIGDDVIYNTGTFTNQSGTISIDRSAQSGIINLLGTFTNQATINIGGIIGTNIGFAGIRNGAIFNNDVGGTININRANVVGIINQGGTFTNKASINLGNTANIIGDGILNAGTFTNETGTININRTGGQGILTQNTGMFTNKATIRIGNLAGIAGNGIQNEAGFTNELSGSININRTGSSGIYNRFSGAFINKGAMAMGTNVGTSIAGDGILNAATFTNEIGSIEINRTGGQGILNQTGMLTNKAMIRIGNLAGIAQSGIQNEAGFTNELGSIDINRTSGSGINNRFSGIFINKAVMTMGTIAGTSISVAGILNQAIFTNETGSISIERTGGDGIANYSPGTFINKASLKIGATASIGGNGIANQAANFINESGAITIDRTTGQGISNDDAFTNKASITIGGVGPIGGDGIANGNPGTFLNDVCAVLTLFDNLNNVSTFHNLGLFTLNTAQPHTNGNLSNDGIIEYIITNPIPNVTNNDIILDPITACPNGTIQPALNIGGANSFTVGSTWYSNSALTIPAGSYVQGTNTFTPTLGQGTYTLFMSIDGVLSCPRTVSIQVNLSDNLPPVPVCMNPTIDLDTFCNPYTLLPIDVFVGGTDNCGVVNVISISPSMVTCADVGNTITVTVTVDDGNGNTATCTSNVGVIQFTSNPVDSRARQEAPLRLNAPAASMQQIHAFPNPATSELNIVLEKEYASGMLQLYDMQGRLAFTQLLEDTSREYHFNVSALASGNYMLRVLLDKEYFVQALIISERE